jgi:hypothetical protein
LSGASSGAIVRIDVFRRLLPRVFQHLALGRGVQKVGVDREGRFAALVLGHRDLVLLGEFDEVRAALEAQSRQGAMTLMSGFRA